MTSHTHKCLSLSRRLLSDLPLDQQLAAGFAGGTRPQDVLVVLRRQLEHRKQPLAVVRPLTLLGGQLLQLDSGAFGQHLQRPALVRLLDELDEREDVAVAQAPEAVPRLHLGVDLEARAVLLVERTEAPELAVALREPDVLRHDLDQVDLRFDLREGVIGCLGGHAPIVRRDGRSNHGVG